jgi:hypothetical protein
MDRAPPRDGAAVAAPRRARNTSGDFTCWRETSIPWRQTSHCDLMALPFRLRSLVWLSGGRIRWRTIQTVLDADTWTASRPVNGDAPGPTLPTSNPYVRLDYVFVAARVRAPRGRLCSGAARRRACGRRTTFPWSSTCTPRPKQ